MTGLTDDFLVELFQCCLKNKNVFLVIRQHLKYQFLPHESYKKIWQAICDHFDSLQQTLPSVGILSQQFERDKDVLAITARIGKTKAVDKDSILNEFQEFIKRSIFLEVYDKLPDTYNQEPEKAFQLLVKASEDIHSFNLKSANYFERAFADFQKRYDEKKLQIILGKNNYQKVPFSIDEYDDITYGGMSEGETALFLAQSGVGKTKFLRHVGVGAARRGFKVVHIQGEGTKQECLDGYDATWSGAKLYHIEHADISPSILKKITTAIKDVTQVWKGEVFIESFEQFGTASLADVRNVLLEIEKIYGHIDLILIDYFELFDPGDGKFYKISEERTRRRKIGQQMKNIAMEFKSRVITCTQASTVSPDQLNDPEFHMTRYNVSEFKAIVEPFSFFASFNQTHDERMEGVMRTYWDKLRKHKAGQIVRFYQDYDNERFYDRKRTIESSLLVKHN